MGFLGIDPSQPVLESGTEKHLAGDVLGVKNLE